jgi:Leucine-rich repeat (LRR) protein
MDQRLIAAIRDRLAARPTDELRRIYDARDLSTWSPEAFEAMRQLLITRGEVGLKPPPSAPSYPPIRINLYWAILWTVAIAMFATLFDAEFESGLMARLLVVASSAIAVANRTGSFAWSLFVLLMWPVGFPVYLIVRHSITTPTADHLKRKRRYHLSPRNVLLAMLLAVVAWLAYGRIREPVGLFLGLIREMRFPDPNVERGIRRKLELGRPKRVITENDLAAIEVLDLQHFGEIRDLTGIEKCVNLHELRIGGTAGDMRPLVGLKSLRILDLQHSGEIREFTGIDQCVNLRELRLDSLSCNLPSLHRLTNLEVLAIRSYTQRASEVLDSVRLCSNLQELRIRGSARDITPLAGLTNLRILELDQTLGRVEPFDRDLTPLQGLRNLETLSLPGLAQCNKRALDLTPLGRLICLRDLRLQLNQIDDLSPLSRLTNLAELQLGANRISDLRPLGTLEHLVVLFLEDNQVRDANPLAALVNLQWLSLGDNQISDVGPLARMQDLRLLQIERNQIRDISPLAALQNLGKQDRQDHGFARRYFDRIRVRRTGPGQRTSSLGAEHDLDLIGNPLNDDAYRVYIPALRERSVKVLLDKGPCSAEKDCRDGEGLRRDASRISMGGEACEARWVQLLSARPFSLGWPLWPGR